MDIRYDSAIQTTIARVRAAAESLSLGAYVLTFGCQQNEADSERLRGLCSEMGYRLVASPEEASLILINTCAIREHAELKALSVIGGYKHLKEKNPSLVIGVVGCMAAEAHRITELKMRYPYVSFTMGPGEIARLPHLVDAALGHKRTFCFTDPNEYPEQAEGIPHERSSRHRAWVSIMYGCNNFCTYCIVPYVRGRERSRPSADVIREVRELVASGVHDITLLGQNVNSYRSDMDFAALLEALAEIPGDFLLRFMTSHPKDVPAELIRVIGCYPKIAPHFHLPLQSGSDEILRRMNRHYDIARYLAVADALRRARPGIALTSDIIVGFPGESEEDFDGTMAILDHVRFDMIYSFIYSPRRGTPAAEYPERVPPEVSRARMERLLRRQDEISLACNLPYVGGAVRVLVDECEGDRLTGRTDTGKLVHFVSEERTVGRFAEVRIDRASPFTLYGTER